MAEYFEFSYGLQRNNVYESESTESSPTKKQVLSIEQSIKAVKALIPSRKDLEFSRQDDDFILRFLYARKMNIQDSFQLMANYFSYRQRNQHLFVHLSAQDESIQHALKDGFPGVLEQRDRKGRRVLVFFTAHWDHCNYSLIAVYRALLLTLEKLVEEKQNQINGFVVIVDWTDFSFRQSSNLNPKILKLMIEGLQDCFPARFKGIHFISQPWYVETVLALIRPFLKEKTKKKIYLHGNNMSTLHEYVSKDILPAELGGESPSFNPMQWAEHLLEISLRRAEESEDNNLEGPFNALTDSCSSSDEASATTATLKKSETVPASMNKKQYVKKPLARKSQHAITTIVPSTGRS